MPPVGKIIYIYKASGSFNAKEILRHRDPKNNTYTTQHTILNLLEKIKTKFAAYFYLIFMYLLQ